MRNLHYFVFSTQKSTFSSEKDPMKTDFHTILREKIDQTTNIEGLTPPHFSSISEPLHLAFLLGTVPKAAYNRPSQHLYKSNETTAKTLHKPNAPLVLEPPIPPASFTQKQKEAWLWFWKRGAGLDKQFNRSDLQKRFRDLARKLHPDQNKHPKAADSFIQLREHYECLCALSDTP